MCAKVLILGSILEILFSPSNYVRTFPLNVIFFSSFHGFSRERKNNQNSKIALLCIYVSLLAFIITFLSGVGNSSRRYDDPVEVNTETNAVPDSDERVEADGGSCTVVAALLHFLMLATLAWNSVYGTQLVLLVRTMRSTLPPYWAKLSHAVGWGGCYPI